MGWENARAPEPGPVPAQSAMAMPDSPSRPRRDVSFLGLGGMETRVLLLVGRGKKPVDKMFLCLDGAAAAQAGSPGIGVKPSALSQPIA